LILQGALPNGSFSRADVDPSEIHPQIELLAKAMDDFAEVPGTKFRIGLDGLLGLIPVVGDLATILIGGLIIQEAERLGVSRWTKLRMYANYAIDLAVGIVPVIGDAFDFAFKAHRRNIRLLQEHVERTKRSRGDRDSNSPVEVRVLSIKTNPPRNVR
jgi:hypothetical protein